jgi:hypothetical protein
MDTLTGVELLTGIIPAGAGAAGVVAGIYMLARRGWWWWRSIAAAGALAGLLALAASWFLVHVSAVSAQDLPWPVTAWTAMAFWAVLLAGLNLTGTGFRRRVLAPAAMAVLILEAALQVKAYFGTYRTLGDVTGASTASIQALPQTARARPGPELLPAPRPVASTWVKPAGLPSAGTINTVQIPGAVSGIAPRSGYLYLPPACQALSRPPVAGPGRRPARLAG